MTFIIWFIGCFCAGIALISLVYFVRNRNRKSMSKGWKVGDVIILNSLETSTNLLKEMKKNNIGSITLCGWNEDNVFYNLGNRVYCESWKSVDTNKSQVWRDNVNKCTEFMGGNPGFNSHVEPEKPNESSGTIDGEPIETMNEIISKVDRAFAV